MTKLRWLARVNAKGFFPTGVEDNSQGALWIMENNQLPLESIGISVERRGNRRRGWWFCEAIRL